MLALKEISIRGDISTNVDYISKLIEFDDFVNNDIDTGWLDVLIKECDWIWFGERNEEKYFKCKN